MELPLLLFRPRTFLSRRLPEFLIYLDDRWYGNISRGLGTLAGWWIGAVAVSGCKISVGDRTSGHLSQARLARAWMDLGFASLFARACRSACNLCALIIAVIRPGNRSSISLQRGVLCISTPRRSPRIRPASRSALKCWDSVDLGIVFSLTLRKFEQFSEQSEPTMLEKMATRTGSERACIIPSTVTSSAEGWERGFIRLNIPALDTYFNSS